MAMDYEPWKMEKMLGGIERDGAGQITKATSVFPTPATHAILKVLKAGGTGVQQAGELPKTHYNSSIIRDELLNTLKKTVCTTFFASIFPPSKKRKRVTGLGHLVVHL